MRLGITLKLLISTLTWLYECNVSRVYAAECKNMELYVPYLVSGSDRTKYQVCFSKTGDFKEYDCPPNLKFNEATRSCTFGLNTIGECTSPGEKLRNPYDTNCKEYVECDDVLEFIFGFCDSDEYFNPLSQKCVPTTEYDCDNDIPDCFDTKFQNRKWVDKESCDSYYECVGDILVSRTCPSGMFLDVHTQACMHNSAVNGVCTVPKPQPNLLVNVKTMCQGNVGKFLPDPYYCKAYYYCVDESTPYWSPCSDGRYFENELCTKIRASSCTCEDLTWEGSNPKPVSVPHPDKTKFYVCKQGKPPEEKTCPAGTTFNPTKKMCSS